jgi:adenylate kinase
MSGVDLRNVSLEALTAEVSRRFNCSFKPNRRVILVGPAGSGKGTQAPKLSEENCWCHLSTGDLLRDEIKRESELGLKVKDVIAAGGLVSDGLVVDIIKNKIKEPMCSYGVIFDGFPRTLAQAEALDNMLEGEGKKIDKVVELEIPDQVLVERITGRRIHLASGRSYHVRFNPPKVEGKDDVTGEPLIQRPDDTEESLMKRLDSYHSQTKPILNHYKSKGSLFTIDANRPISSVWQDLLSGTNN